MTSIGEVPLSDTGDLYADGNAMPAFHAAAAPAVTPVDGVVGVVSLGMSNAKEEWSAFVDLASARSDLAPLLRFANGAVSGHTMAMWADPANDAWDFAVNQITTAGVRTDQVRIVWMKMGSRIQELGDGSLSERVALEQGWLNQILATAATTFPNLQQVYFSSRIYAGYETSSNHAETQTGYDNGFAVKAVVEDAVAGQSPMWAAWGPYLWADGVTPRRTG